MATKGKEKEEKAEEERIPLVETVHKVLLAAIGAVALAQEELEDFVNKLVERGEIAEKEGKAMMRDLREKRKTQAEKAGSELDTRIEELLKRMNVPTKGDIADLSDKITVLTKKVDDLKQD